MRRIPIMSLWNRQINRKIRKIWYTKMKICYNRYRIKKRNDPSFQHHALIFCNAQTIWKVLSFFNRLIRTVILESPSRYFPEPLPYGFLSIQGNFALALTDPPPMKPLPADPSKEELKRHGKEDRKSVV